MAEVGLVRFGQVALDVAQTTVPRYRTTFSKHQFMIHSGPAREIAVAPKLAVTKFPPLAT
jgi:hypothetical protein